MILLTLIVTTVDYILQNYNLPRDLDTLRNNTLHRPSFLMGTSLLAHDHLGLSCTLSLGSDRYRLTREQKLLILFEYLGVDTSMEPLRGTIGNLALDGGYRRLGGGLLGGFGGGRIGGD